MFGKSNRPAGGPPQMAYVRYEDAGSAQSAAEQLNGSSMNGTMIEVVQDPRSSDGRKCIVNNIPSEAAWQEIKDHFNTAGRVQFADIINNSGIGGTVSGTVRYNTTEEALLAIQSYNGTDMNGNIIEVQMHGGTKDQTKIQITGMPPGTEWQEVKDHFGQIGTIAFAEAYSSDNKLKGEIRYDDPSHAQIAMATLNGSLLQGSPISIEFDMGSRDNSRLIVHGIPAGCEWQELKDHFKTIGTVAFSDIKGAKGKGKGGKGGGKNQEGMVQVPVQLLNQLMQNIQGGGGGGMSFGQAKGANKGCYGAMGGMGGKFGKGGCGGGYGGFLPY